MTGVLVVLVVANVMSNRVLPAWAYVPWNASVAISIVLIARRVLTLPQMGFTEWRSGARWGGALFGATTVVLMIGLAIPVFHQMFHDRRVSDGTWTWIYQAFIRIPFGTALLEETAFRAVLPALFAARWGVLRGSVLASMWFGLWHVLPALDLRQLNPQAGSWLGLGLTGQLLGIAFAVVGTALAGLWWCWVRYRSRSILSTVVGHVASNSIAYTIAFIISR